MNASGSVKARGWLWPAGVLVGVVAIVVLGGRWLPARAEPALVTFNVNSTLDQIDADLTDGLCRTAAGTCTLRAAVMQANTISGQGTQINLPAGTYTLTRPATAANGPDTGDLNLTTPANGNPVITISGAGAATTIIDANGLDRVLAIAAGRTATFSGLTVRNGFHHNPGGRAEGGGIYNTGELALEKVAIRDNTASGGSRGTGGGVYNFGILTVVGSTFSGNEAGGQNPAGGAITNDREGTGQIVVLTISGSTFTGNKAAFGGAIYNQNAELVVNGSTLDGNESTSAGGAVYNLNGAVTVAESTISHNEGPSGGGVYNAGILHLFRSTVRHNRSTSSLGSGGGLDNADSALLRITDSTISENEAYTGGGLYNAGDLFVVNSTISLNRAMKTGGGVYNDGVANAYNVTIVFNEADADIDFDGEAGGVYSRSFGTGVAFNLRNTLLAGNFRSGAPEYTECGGKLTVFGVNLIGITTLDGDSVTCAIDNNFGDWALFNSLAFLGQLADNGGPTPTHALLAGSNAIDGGDPDNGCVDQNSAVLQTDQRGAPRVAGLRCDIGAFEFGALPPPPPPPAAIRLYFPVGMR
jgi:hypothetical protein